MLGMLQTLRNRFRSMRQTHTASSRDLHSLRQAGTAAAYRRSAALLTMIQVMLWAGLQGTSAAGRGVWLSALILLPVAMGVWGISRWLWGNRQNDRPFAARQESASRPGQQRATRDWELLPLLICPVLDAIWLLQCLISVMHRLMPSYPLGILRVILPVVLSLGVLLGKRNGAAYGVSLWRWVLPLAAVWVMLTVLGNQGTTQLYPLMGRGWIHTGKAALSGLGALWPCALMFLLPHCAPMRKNPYTGRKAHTVQYVLLPVATGCLLAFTLACAGAWMWEEETIGQRLLLAGRSGGHMLTSGLWSLFFLIGLMTAFCTSLMAAQKLTQRIWPGVRGWLPVLAATLPAAVLLWVWQKELLPFMAQLLPWRFACWAAAASGAGIRRYLVQRKASHAQR